MSSSTQLYGYVKDGLTILVLPALLWLVKLEVSNAERDFQLQQTKIDIERLEARINEFKDIDNRVQQNALQLARLEGKIDSANDRLDEIRGLLKK